MHRSIKLNYLKVMVITFSLLALTGCISKSENIEDKYDDLQLIDRPSFLDIRNFYEDELKIANISKQKSKTTQQAEFRDLLPYEEEIVLREIAIIEDLLSKNDYEIEYSTSMSGTLEPRYIEIIHEEDKVDNEDEELSSDDDIDSNVIENISIEAEELGLIDSTIEDQTDIQFDENGNVIESDAYILDDIDTITGIEVNNQNENGDLEVVDTDVLENTDVSIGTEEDIKYEYDLDENGNVQFDENGKVLMKIKEEKEVEEAERQEFLLVHPETKGTFTKQMFNSIKFGIDDKVLYKESLNIVGVTREILIVDVNYSVGTRQEGVLIDDARYIGVHGIFRKDQYGNSYRDDLYLNRIEKEIEKLNEIKKLQEITGEGISSYSEDAVNLRSSRMYRQEGSYIEIADIDIAQYNSALGVLMSSDAIMPRLGMVFNIVGETKGNIGGYGIFAQGNRALTEFKYNRSAFTGTAVIRYIFRTNIETGIIQFDDIYLKELHMNVPEILNKDVFPPSEERAISILIDRVDRVILNNDIAGMANGRIFGSIRPAIFYGEKLNSVWVERRISSVSNYLRRTDRFWLVEVEVITTESVKYSELGPGTYTEKYQMVLEQVADNFIIVDYLLTDKTAIIEPTIVFGSNIAKKYINMYNSEVITDENKIEVKEFISNLYRQAEEREWDEIVSDFNSDIEVLSSDDRRQMSSSIRSIVNRIGSDREVSYYGYVTEWLGGSSNPRVELITKELIVYEQEMALEQNCYYVISKYDDNWVIDAFKILDSEEIGERRANEVYREIKGYQDKNNT